MVFTQAYLILLLFFQKIRGLIFFQDSSFLNKGYALLDYKFNNCEIGNKNLMDGNWKDKNDVRFFGAQYFDSSVYSFYSNLKLYQSFKDLGISIPLRNETTLMGNLTFEKDVFNGSGGGWHIDSWGFQPKAMTYLTDVSPDNGPFQYIEGSQKFVVQLFIFINARLRKGTRIDENLVQKVLKWFPSCKLIEFTGQKGSILLFDPRGIHRGKPILEGKRIALTNYYVPNFLTTTSIGKLDLKIKNSVKK